MGIKDNLKKIIEGYRHKNTERNLESEVERANIDDTEFYKEYGSFTDGLDRQLTKLLADGNLSVTFKVTHPNHIKYFRAVMDDEEFTNYYEIEMTSGGEVVFSLKELDLGQ